jgi:hypothetical protein
MQDSQSQEEMLEASKASLSLLTIVAFKRASLKSFDSTDVVLDKGKITEYLGYEVVLRCESTAGTVTLRQAAYTERVLHLYNSGTHTQSNSLWSRVFNQTRNIQEH